MAGVHDDVDHTKRTNYPLLEVRIAFIGTGIAPVTTDANRSTKRNELDVHLGIMRENFRRHKFR